MACHCTCEPTRAPALVTSPAGPAGPPFAPAAPSARSTFSRTPGPPTNPPPNASSLTPSLLQFAACRLPRGTCSFEPPRLLRTGFVVCSEGRDRSLCGSNVALAHHRGQVISKRTPCPFSRPRGRGPRRHPGERGWGSSPRTAGEGGGMGRQAPGRAEGEAARRALSSCADAAPGGWWVHAGSSRISSSGHPQEPPGGQLGGPQEGGARRRDVSPVVGVRAGAPAPLPPRVAQAGADGRAPIRQTWPALI